MLERKYLFPRVIEMNYQAGHRLGINIYLIDGGSEFLLIDAGFIADLEDVAELIRKMDFELASCKMLVLTHADADHTQVAARARELFRTKTAAHPASVKAIESGDRETTFASI